MRRRTIQAFARRTNRIVGEHLLQRTLLQNLFSIQGRSQRKGSLTVE